jgi:hypothetical protein
LAVTLAAGIADAPASLAAQVPPARLSGRVTTPDGRPAAGVQLIVLVLEIRTSTAADGTYEIREIPPGPQSVEFRLIGHRTAHLDLDFQSGTLLQRDVQLEVQPIPLDSLEARAASPVISPQMQGFYERRERGGGYFYTREEVGKMQARQFTDVMRRVPGATLQPVNGPFGTSYVLQLARTTGLTRICPILYYMNGTPFPIGPDNSINNYVVPDDLAGVEVYSGASRVPPQFNSGPQNSRCGVVVIWTFNGRGRAPGL